METRRAIGRLCDHLLAGALSDDDSMGIFIRPDHNRRVAVSELANPSRGRNRGTEHDGRPSRPAALRDLLARRLVRERKFQEAAPYFQAEETKAAASEYAQLLARAEDKRSDLAKARLFYMAAIIARRSGMQI